MVTSRSLCNSLVHSVALLTCLSPGFTTILPSVSALEWASWFPASCFVLGWPGGGCYFINFRLVLGRRWGSLSLLRTLTSSVPSASTAASRHSILFHFGEPSPQSSPQGEVRLRRCGREADGPFPPPDHSESEVGIRANPSRGDTGLFLLLET